ncbi:MAG: hypothetical protein OET08_13810 [Desulfuromonadales bacterium]|jgi:hypothetical protein|nr:hypothetical protein [Desulfuromonadales bacterium]
MLIPVVLKDGQEELVSKEELQFLLLTQKVMLFKRSDGWAVLGRNRMRNQRGPYNGEERRQRNFYSLT